MASMQALLKIKASTEGEGAIASMARGLGGLKGAAEKAQGGLKGLLDKAGGLGGVLGTLVPALSIGGLTMLATKSINAADDMNDLSQKTGVSVERLSQFQQAARDSGSSIEDVGKGLIVLGRNLSMSIGATQRFGMSVEDMAKKAEESERRQTEALQNQADRRITLLQDESDSRMRELNSRYRKEQQVLDDRYNDQADREREAADQVLTQQERAIQRQFELRRRALEAIQGLSDVSRADALGALRNEEEDTMRALRSRFERQNKERTRQLRDAQRAEEELLNAKRTQEENALRQSLNRQTELIRQGLKQQLESMSADSNGPNAFAKAMQALGVSAVDANGKLRPTSEVMLDISEALSKLPDGAQKAGLAMDLFNKKVGPGLIPFLNNGRAAIEAYVPTITTEFAKAADNFNDKLGTMTSKIDGLVASLTQSGLLDLFEKMVDGLISLSDAFAKMPGWVKGATVALVGLALILPGVISLLVNLLTLQKAIIAANIGGAIAGNMARLLPLIQTISVLFTGLLGTVGPFFALLSAMFTTFLTFLTGTVLPALLAFFSGPAGWITLAVIAVVAMAIAFRKPLTDFFSWLWKWGEPIRKFWVDLWNGAVSLVSKVFNGAAETIKNVFRGILQFIADRLNFTINLIKPLITAFNRLPGPDIPVPQPITVPKFADGGFVTRPTVGLVGEAGPEYIIPANRMAAASANYLAGARGGAVLNGSPQINVTTGPVLQQDGRRYVTIDDLERAMRLTAEGVLGRMRTPAARSALGIR